ncbi:hypothetical protein ABIE86_000080 [Bradyrhizobium diazoefficiens]
MADGGTVRTSWSRRTSDCRLTLACPIPGAPTRPDRPARSLSSSTVSGSTAHHSTGATCQPDFFCKFLARSAGLAISRWDGGRGDLGQSAGSGSSAPRCKRGGTRSGHHHEALTTSERTIGQLITLKPGDSKSAYYYELAIDPPAALAPSAQPRPAPSGRALLLCHMASKKVDNNPQLKSRLAIALILGRSAAVSRLGPIVVAPMTTRI